MWSTTLSCGSSSWVLRGGPQSGVVEHDDPAAAQLDQAGVAELAEQLGGPKMGMPLFMINGMTLNSLLGHVVFGVLLGGVAGLMLRRRA